MDGLLYGYERSHRGIMNFDGNKIYLSVPSKHDDYIQSWIVGVYCNQKAGAHPARSRNQQSSQRLLKLMSQLTHNHNHLKFISQFSQSQSLPKRPKTSPRILTYVSLVPCARLTERHGSFTLPPTYHSRTIWRDSRLEFAAQIVFFIVLSSLSCGIDLVSCSLSDRMNEAFFPPTTTRERYCSLKFALEKWRPLSRVEHTNTVLLAPG